MIKSGHIKDVTQDEDSGFRQFIINCLGNNDNRKYFSLSPFGVDFVAPENTRSLTSESMNKDVNYNMGVLNKIHVDDLNAGECVIFSTDEAGETLKSKQVYRNNGNIEINEGMANGNIIIKADGTIEFNGNADFLTGFTKNKEGFDQHKSDYNAHKHQIPAGTVIVSVSGGSGAPAVGVLNPAPIDLTGTDKTTSASIDDAKKENLKCE
jgi:hypothetical protein